LSEIEVKDIEVTTFPEQPKTKKKKKKKRKSSVGSFFATFFLTLFAFCGVGVVMLIFASEQLNFTLPGNWFSGQQTTSYPEHPVDTYGLVGESATVADSYFEDAVFVGDSLTHGMKAYDKMVGTSYGVTGISVSDAIWRDKYTLKSGRMGTAVDAASELKPGKIYLMFGTNGVNYMYDYTPIIEDYKVLIQHIRQKNPDALIYVQSIPPVTQGYSYAYPRLKPENIQKYNGMLKEMTEAEQCYFLDSYSVLSTESGHLPQMYTSDSGLHINNKAYDAMFGYIKSHTVKK